MEHNKIIGKELKVLNNLIRRHFETHTQLKGRQLSRANCWIIGMIAEKKDHDVCQRDFEREFHISRSTASKVVNLMEKKGYIQKVPVEGDARLKKLTLLEPSYEVLKCMQEDELNMEKRLTQGFTEEELATLRAYIKRMQQNMAQ